MATPAEKALGRTPAYAKPAVEKAIKALSLKGMNLMAEGTLADRYPDDRTLFVFNRGVKEDGVTLSGKSNYFGLLIVTKGRIAFWCTNPDESREASAFTFDDYEITVTFKGFPGRFAEQVAAAAEANMARKPERAYRIYLHSHLSELMGTQLNVAGSGMTDDGLSGCSAYLLNLINHNADYFALTPHNHFLLKEWSAFDAEARKYGIIGLPGFEATLPIFQHEPWLEGTTYGQVHNPNGPHVLLLFRTPEFASQFWSENFGGRYYTYAPCASEGVELSRIYDLIDSKYPGEVARMVAHPACDVGLPSVGIANRAAKGEISLSEFLSIIGRSQGIALFNTVAEDAPLDFAAYMRDVQECGYFSEDEKARRLANISEFAAWLERVMERNIGSKAMTPNNINMAVAKESGKLSFVDTDSHNFNWLYTKHGPFFWRVKDMGLLGRGHNTLWLPSVPGEKPSASDVAGFFIDNGSLGGARFSAKLFSTMEGGKIVTTKERLDVSFLQSVWDQAEKLHSYVFRQGVNLIGNIFKASQKQGALHVFGTMDRDSIPKSL